MCVSVFVSMPGTKTHSLSIFFLHFAINLYCLVMNNLFDLCSNHTMSKLQGTKIQRDLICRACFLIQSQGRVLGLCVCLLVCVHVCVCASYTLI